MKYKSPWIKILFELESPVHDLKEYLLVFDFEVQPDQTGLWGTKGAKMIDLGRGPAERVIPLCWYQLDEPMPLRTIDFPILQYGADQKVTGPIAMSVTR